MPKALVNGIQINYQRVGQGSDVVMLHGLGSSAAFWYLPIVPSLKQDFRVTVYDLRGHGRSDMPACGYTTASMAADLHALLEHLEISRAHLVGHSFGGAVALHFAVLHPEHVASLTLADARIRALQPVQRLTDSPRWESEEKWLQELGVSIGEDEREVGFRLLEEFAKVDGRSAGEGSRDVAASFVPFREWRGNKAGQRWLRLLDTTSAKADFTAVSGLTVDVIRRVTPPILALFGEYSRCLPSCYRLKEILPSCNIVIVPHGGHFHPVVKPRVFIDAFTRFISELER